jgi:hypothetical protein
MDETLEFIEKMKESPIEPGDIVLLVKEAEYKEKGWKYPWVSSMNKYIGKLMIVLDNKEGTNQGFLIKDFDETGKMYVPYFVLQLVKKGGYEGVDVQKKNSEDVQKKNSEEEIDPFAGEEMFTESEEEFETNKYIGRIL